MDTQMSEYSESVSKVARAVLNFKGFGLKKKIEILENLVEKGACWKEWRDNPFYRILKDFAEVSNFADHNVGVHPVSIDGYLKYVTEYSRSKLYLNPKVALDLYCYFPRVK